MRSKVEPIHKFFGEDSIWFDPFETFAGVQELVEKWSLTGSRCFFDDIFDPEIDVDVLLLLKPNVPMPKFCSVLHGLGVRGKPDEYKDNFKSYHAFDRAGFKDINFIACTDPAQFDMWLKATHVVRKLRLTEKAAYLTIFNVFVHGESIPEFGKEEITL